MKIFKKIIKLEGKFDCTPSDLDWKFICRGGECYLIENPMQIPHDTHNEFKVVATLSSFHKDVIKILKTKVIVEKTEDWDDFPDFGTAF